MALSQLAQMLGGAGLGNALGQQQMANDYQSYVNAYGNHWLTTSSSAASTISIGEVVYLNTPTPTPKKHDEFSWLRERVEEVCWQQAA